MYMRPITSTNETSDARWNQARIDAWHRVNNAILTGLIQVPAMEIENALSIAHTAANLQQGEIPLIQK